MKPEQYPSEPSHIWNIFYDFTQTPRPSKHEDKIRQYLLEIANENSLEHVVDQAGNIVIYVPGKNGRENDEPLIIQNHIDMVTDAAQGVDINFKQDPLKLSVDGDWLKAIGTTLGADNGIGCAAALATIYDKDLVHPPLELLFTVDEETGLHGALGLEAKYLSAKKMLNLDTEEWGSLYIGCAGGIDYELNREFKLNSISAGKKCIKLVVSNLVGGHSGVDIHQQRGNAIKLLGEVLFQLKSAFDFELEEVRGGRAHNIIPRDAFAIIWVNESQMERLQEVASTLISRWKSYLPKEDQSVEIEFEPMERTGAEVLSQEDRNKIISFLNLFPHGAHTYDLEDKSLVSMSNNFARILLVRGKFYTQASLRFFDREEVKALEERIRSIGEVFGMDVTSNSEYPSWKPVRENNVLEKVKEIYKEMYKEEANITAIHAGLECGILRDKIGPIDVISFGPTIMGAHSPDERVNIPSVEKFWNLFTETLKRI